MGPVKSQVEVAIDEARALASVFEAAEETNGATMTRQTADAILRHFIESNTQFLDVFVAFEPNAFDNSDARFAGTAGHDSTGRYIPVWSRDADGKGVVEALKDYDVKGAGDYYQVPKERKKESVINPSFRTLNGKDVLMTSLVVPILDANGAFIGVAGIDIDLGFIEDFVKGAKIGSFREPMPPSTPTMARSPQRGREHHRQARGGDHEGRRVHPEGALQCVLCRGAGIELSRDDRALRRVHDARRVHEHLVAGECQHSRG